MRPTRTVAATTVLALAFLFPARPAPAAEHTASSAADVAKLSPDLKPGDTVLLADGTWTDQAVTFAAGGTADDPVTFRAKTPGKLVLTGASSIIIDGHHVVVSGIHLKDGKGGKDGITVRGSNCRLTGSAVTAGDYKFFVHLIGPDNRVDHCYLADKTSGDPTFQVEVGDQPNNNQVDHNHFGPRPPLGRNGGETIRVGYSGQSMRNSRTVVESNLFDRCDGEIEIISSKSCENVYRGNTFLDCAGMLTLRHGNRCVVDSNFFLAHHKKGSGGVRIIGEDHVVTNNYIDGVDKGGFWITSGVPDSKLNEYFQAKRCVVAFNTVVDSAGPCLDLSAGLGTSGRTLKPEKIAVANNVLSVGDHGQLLKGDEGEGWTWAGNLAAGGGPAKAEHAGVKAVDLKLVKGIDGRWKPATDSPARGAAEGDVAGFPKDIDGQPRPAKAADAGCDQASDAPVTNRPLTAADVGPSWLPRMAGEKPDGAAAKPAAAAPPATRPATQPAAALPGRGLAQHPFLYSGEWDTRKPVQTMFLVRDGKVVWTYQIPRKDPNGNESEFSDMHRLSNGDIVFAYKTGWRKINVAGETIYDYQCPKTDQGWTECHSAQPVGADKVLFMQNGTPAKLMLLDLKAGKVEMEHVMRTKEPVDQKSVHGQFRNVRRTAAGTYLIAHMNLGKVIEYDRDWKEVWSCDAPSVWHAVRLKNGNTLISGNQHAFVREVSPKGEVVWEVKDGDLPGIKINSVHQARRLANGNTVFCNWTAGVKKEDWPTIVQVIEVTPEKKVVWALREWTDPDLGPASCIQLLDEPGADEDGELQR